MDVLTDTNVLIRGVHRKAARHREALQSLRILRNRGDRVCVVPQNIYEFWTVATPPVENNGLGLTLTQTDRILSRIEELCTVLRDPPGIYDEWRKLVVHHGVLGKKTHDARLVAAMKVHRITHILTLNPRDFGRYAGITIIEPTILVLPQS